MGRALAVRRHRAELGDPVATFSGRPGPGTILAFLLVWVASSALTFIRPDPDPVLAIAPTILFALMLGAMLLLLSGERLIVCERGLIIGSVAPFLSPYVVRFEQIVPGSVVPVLGARRYGAETGTQQLPQSCIRRYWWTSAGVHLVGPSPKEARRRTALLAPLLDPPARSVDARWIWFVGLVGDPTRATAAIAAAAQRAGFAQLAEATSRAAARELTGNPADAAAQLPGHRPAR